MMSPFQLPLPIPQTKLLLLSFFHSLSLGRSQGLVNQVLGLVDSTLILKPEEPRGGYSP
jgi:hypothetical protein